MKSETPICDAAKVYNLDDVYMPIEVSENLERQNTRLREALFCMVELYTHLVKSGDAGSWDPEDDLPVVVARRLLAQEPGKGEA